MKSWNRELHFCVDFTLRLKFVLHFIKPCLTIFFSFLSMQRGVISSPNNEYYIINPLPRRFHRTSASIPHVIVKWAPPGRMPSCASQHPHSINKHVPHEDSGAYALERDHRLLTSNSISAFDSSRTLKCSDNSNSRHSSSERACDLHKSDRAELKENEASEDATKGSHAFSKDLLKTTDSSPVESGTALGHTRHTVIRHMTKCHNCSEEEHLEVQSREKRSPALLPEMPIHVETAVFIDKDLYQHMALNFPADTERELVRVVLAMINAVSQYPHNGITQLC
jgi:hypothetical protein